MIKYKNKLIICWVKSILLLFKINSILLLFKINYDSNIQYNHKDKHKDNWLNKLIHQHYYYKWSTTIYYSH